jgi:hypothetical protein
MPTLWHERQLGMGADRLTLRCVVFSLRFMTRVSSFYLLLLMPGMGDEFKDITRPQVRNLFG